MSATPQPVPLPLPGLSISLVWQNRLVSGAVAAVFLVATRQLLPELDARAEAQYLIVVTLGYGHLIGAWVFSRRRAEGSRPAGLPHGLFAPFVLLNCMALFPLYGLLFDTLQPSLAAPGAPLIALMLGASLWHTVENDRSLPAAYQRKFKIGEVPRSLDSHLMVLGITALILALGYAAMESSGIGHTSFPNPRVIAGVAVGSGLVLLGRRAGPSPRSAVALLLGGSLCMCIPPGVLEVLSFSDFFAASTLYHLVQWLMLFRDRARCDEPSGTQIWRRVIWVHVPPGAVCVALLVVPWSAPLRDVLFSPAVYLFGSFLHVVQTLVVRGLAPR